MSTIKKRKRTKLLACKCCGCDVPAGALYSPLSRPDMSPICFACIFIHSLSGAPCEYCGATPCGAFIAVQHANGSVGPASLCAKCVLEQDAPEERMVCVDDGRSVLSESEEVS